MNYVRQFIFALTFLTRIPVPFKIEYNKKLPGRSMAFYPLVGIIIGVIVVLFDRCSMFIFSLPVRNTIVLIGFICVSGGLHLDGFMDTVDGIFSGRKSSRIKDIMHDSQIGAFGVIALFLLLLLKFNLLLELQGVNRISVLIMMPALGRFMIILAAKYFPLSDSSKLGRDFIKGCDRIQVFISCIWILFLFLCLYYFYSFSAIIFLIILSLCILISLIVGTAVVSKIDGLTGDVYGAISEIAEVVVLISFITVS